MGQKFTKQKTQAERDLAAAKQELLDTQDLTAKLYEQNQLLQSDLLDVQELVAKLAEGGNV